MTQPETEQAIANYLSFCDLIMAVGSKSAKRKAIAHRKACVAEINSWNADIPKMTDDELLEALGI